MGTIPRKKAYFSEEFKRSVVTRIERGELSVLEARREYRIGGSTTVYKWLSRYGGGSSGVPEGSEDQAEGMKAESVSKSQSELAAEVQALRRLLDLERLRSEAYLEMIKLAESRYGIAIEKKSGARQSQR